MASHLTSLWNRGLRHINDLSLPRFGHCFWLVVSREKFALTNQEHYPDLFSERQYGISAVIAQTSFRGKPVVTSRNIGCFLRLVQLSPNHIPNGFTYEFMIVSLISAGFKKHVSRPKGPRVCPKQWPQFNLWWENVCAVCTFLEKQLFENSSNKTD